MSKNVFCSHFEPFPVSIVIGAKDKPYVITEDVVYTLSSGDKYVVEKGFRLDGTSVPRLLRGLMPRINNKIIGSTLHDHMWNNDYKRIEWGDKKAKEFSNRLMFIIVKSFGGSIFNRWKNK